MGKFAVLTAAFLAGITGPVLKLGLNSFSPTTLMFVRFLCASLIFSVFYIKRKHPLSLEYLKKPLKYSFIGALSLVLVIEGLSRTTVSSMQAIFMSRPLLLAFGGAVLLKERIKKNQFVGLMVGLMGFILVASQPYVYGGTNISVGTLQGNILIALSGLAGVAYTLCARKLSKTYPPEVLAYCVFIAAVVVFSLIIVVQAALGMDVAVGALQHNDWYILTFLVFFSTILMFFLHLVGLKLTSAVYVGIGYYIQFLVTVIMGVKLFGDDITPLFTVGSILILGAAIIGGINSKSHNTK